MVTSLPVEFLPGYVVYLAAIFVPGYGLWEVLGRWKDDDTLADRLGFSFGVGIAVDTIVFALKTLGLGVGFLYGATIGLVYFLILVGVAALGVSYARRRRFTGPPRFARDDLATVFFAAFVAAVIALYLGKFPIFPYFNPDFLVHQVQATGLTLGTLSSVPRMLVYGAADYQLGMALLAVGGLPLATVRHTMALLTVLSPFFVYAVAKRLFASRRAALFAAAIFALSGTVWTPLVLNDGLYANFIGVLLELLLVVGFLDLSSGYRSPSVWLSSGVFLVAGYFSHYTAISTFGAFLFFSVALGLLRRPSARGHLLATAVFLAPGALGALVFHSTVTNILNISYNEFSSPGFTTYVSRLLSPIPSVAFIAVDVSNDPGFVALFALLALGLYWAYRSRSLPALLLGVWFFALLAVSPENGGAWRFGFEAVVPVILLAGYGLDSLLSRGPAAVPKKVRLRAPKSQGFRRVGMVAVCLLFLVPIVYNGWAWSTAQNATVGTQQEAQVQSQLLQAMTWMGQNTPPTSLVLSVTDPRFIFARTVIDRITSDHYSASPNDSISFARAHGESYIVVTRYDVDTGNGTVVSDSQSLPWYTYPQSAGLTLVYKNGDVMIFEIASTA